MNKRLIIIIVLTLVALAGIYFLVFRTYCETVGSTSSGLKSPQEVFPGADNVNCKNYFKAFLMVFNKGPKNAERTTPSTSFGTKIDTADWQTYRNEKYGFEFRYPEGNIVEYGRYVSESGTQPAWLERVSLYDLFSIGVFSKDIVKGDYDWPERPCGEWSFGESGTAESMTKTTFTNYKMLHVVTVMEKAPRDASHFYCINYPPNPLVIEFNENQKTKIDQILSTFKFTK